MSLTRAELVGIKTAFSNVHRSVSQRTAEYLAVKDV